MKEALKIIKIGGNIIDDKNALEEFLKLFSAIEGFKILVHGGGKAASEMSTRLGIDVKLIDGRRLTDAGTLDIITMVYGGRINKQIVTVLQANKTNAIGLSGADANTIISRKRPIKELDYGFVGDIISVNSGVIEGMLNQHLVPVFCAITHDGKGQLLNTNADTIASELAIGMSDCYEVDLLYCFEKSGVLRDSTDDSTVIRIISNELYKNLKSEGVIVDGMIPKMDNCFHAIKNGVNKVCIGNIKMIKDKDNLYTTLVP